MSFPKRRLLATRWGPINLQADGLWYLPLGAVNIPAHLRRQAPGSLEELLPKETLDKDFEKAP